jgi:hypothetical protein
MPLGNYRWQGYLDKNAGNAGRHDVQVRRVRDLMAVLGIIEAAVCHRPTAASFDKRRRQPDGELCLNAGSIDLFFGE